MNDERAADCDRSIFTLDQPITYQIQIAGQLSENWSDWIEFLDIRSEMDPSGCVTTTLIGSFDQAALIGLLRRLYYVGYPLISVKHDHTSSKRRRKKMHKSRRIILGIAVILGFISIFGFVVWQPTIIRRVPYPAPEPAYHSWEDILSHPQPITIRTYSTGMMTTLLSVIMNLEHSQAQDIKDELVQYPVNVSIIQHQEFGTYLIDAGLDASYVDNPLGSMKGIMTKNLGRATQDPNTDIATILDREKVQIRGVFLTHLHFDHTAGILDFPKDIPYFVSRDEPYANFRFFYHGDHLAGVDEIYDIDLAEGIELSPLGKSVDVFGDGSLWAISASGHSKGQIMYFVNGIKGQILVTGDACNTRYQFDTGVGPGGFSSDLEQAQETLDRIIAFKEQYPEVKLVYGHDL